MFRAPDMINVFNNITKFSFYLRHKVSIQHDRYSSHGLHHGEGKSGGLGDQTVGGSGQAEGEV